MRGKRFIAPALAYELGAERLCCNWVRWLAAERNASLAGRARQPYATPKRFVVIEHGHKRASPRPRFHDLVGITTETAGELGRHVGDVGRDEHLEHGERIPRCGR